MIYFTGIVFVFFLVIVCLISSLSRGGFTVIIPGSELLQQVNQHAVSINVVSFILERCVTLDLFGVRFLWKHVVNKQAALTLNVPLLRLDAEL